MSEYVRMTIAVPKEAYGRLQESALRDMRHPRQQVHWLLYQALGLTQTEVQSEEMHNRTGEGSEAVPSAVAS